MVNDLLGNLVGADDESVSVGNGLIQVVHIGILFQKGQFIAVLLHYFADTVDGHFRERFFCCN